MPTFEITTPEGHKYRVTGENEAGALEALKGHLGSAQPAQSPAKAEYDALPWYGKAAQAADDVVRLGINGVTWGLADKAAGYLSGNGAEAERAKSQEARDRAGSAGVAAEIGGGVLGAGKLMKAGVTATRFVPEALTGVSKLLATSAAGGVDALGLNTASNWANDRNLGDNAGLSIALGTAATPVSMLASKGIDVAKGALGYGNAPRAKRAILEVLKRSGKSTADVVNELDDAARAGQPYALADSLGNPGQRMLTGIARSPGDARTKISTFMDNRQAGQGKRIATALEEGFGAPETAAQKAASLTTARRTAAKVNYPAAREAAGAVDTSAAIKSLDDILQPGVTPMIGTGAADDSVFNTLKRARSYLTNGKTAVSDFDRALRAKIEMDAIIEKGGPASAMLRDARNSLDDALANASKPYANARDTYKAGSKAIEAVDAGKKAAMRGRVEDTIPAYSKMGATEQDAFRHGYVDPLIEHTQGGAIGVNKARPLITDATASEFPAFAKPGNAKDLADKIARENTMFETRAAAFGNSRTAENLADMADVGSFDPSIALNLAAGNWKQSALTALSKASNALQGRNKTTRDLIADALLKTGGNQAQNTITQAIQSGISQEEKNKLIARALMAMGIIGAGQVN